MELVGKVQGTGEEVGGGCMDGGQGKGQVWG